jgi:hypothetical protein
MTPQKTSPGSNARCFASPTASSAEATPLRRIPASTSTTSRRPTSCWTAASDASSAASAALATEARRVRSVTTFASSTSLMPTPTAAATSSAVAQVIPDAPVASCSSAISVNLWCFRCGRSDAPLPAKDAAIRRMLRSIASRSMARNEVAMPPGGSRDAIRERAA